MSNRVIKTEEQSKNMNMFSLREVQCIVQILDGKSLFEVAENLNINERSVDFYLKNGKQKLRRLLLNL